MKKKLLILCMVLSFTKVGAQISLTPQLVDSIVSHIEIPGFDKILPQIEIIKFIGDEKRKNQIVVSHTYVTIRKDIPNESFLYSSNGKIVFLTFSNIDIHSGLLRKLINDTERRYSILLDSINFLQKNHTGAVPIRLTLDVIKIRKCWFNDNIYKLNFSKVFPAIRAPRELLPVEKFIDGGYMVDPPYKYLYNWKGEMLEEYKQQLIPKEPVKIKML